MSQEEALRNLGTNVGKHLDQLKVPSVANPPSHGGSEQRVATKQSHQATLLDLAVEAVGRADRVRLRLSFESDWITVEEIEDRQGLFSYVRKDASSRKTALLDTLLAVSVEDAGT
ncbi:MAG: hypothetical protein P0Y59_02525 [Candidatus Sphingomonas phytovorans]|nr:hypothetical protein [Sphingomonas sp.]WEK00586.1 MAG: hypothetical protein P0Y59_02525 [Sphingomonas sp.]